MSDPTTAPGVVPIIPCIDIAESTAFYQRLGFVVAGDYGDYKLLDAPGGLRVHLRAATDEGLDPKTNALGIYVYVEDVDAIAALAGELIIGPHKAPHHMPWGTYEFAMSDPSGTLVRVGRPSA